MDYFLERRVTDVQSGSGGAEILEGEVWLTEERLVLVRRGCGGGVISDGSAPWCRATPPVSAYTSRPGKPPSVPPIVGANPPQRPL